MNRTPSENTKPVFLYAGTPTSGFTSAELDCTGFDNGHVTILVATATGSASAITTIKVQEAATSGGGLTDITNAAFTNISTSNDGELQAASIQLRGTEKFLKVIGTGGGSNDAPIVITAVLSGASNSASNDVTFVFEV